MPKDYAKREAEIVKGQGLVGNQIEYAFEIGNRYEEVKDFKMNTSGTKEMKHRWSLYIKPLDDNLRKNKHLVIDKVKLYLHPTFRQPTRWIKPEAGKPLELANVLSWGWFDIDVSIFWTKKTG